MKSEENSKVNLNDLIQQIQTEGVTAAEKKAAAILEQAKKEADKIIEQANNKAGKIIKEAEENIAKKDNISRLALEQAARDMVLAVKESLIEQFNYLINRECNKNLSGVSLENLLERLISNLAKEEMFSTKIFLNETEHKILLEQFYSKFQQEFEKGIELKFHPTVEAGFKVGIENKNLYYDFTEEGISTELAKYLSPKFRDILTEASKDN